MTHGFDNIGSNMDENGSLKDWWSPETKRAFVHKQKCFVDQYNNYTFPVLQAVPGYHGPVHVNGKHTLGENIADNGGIRQAYRAYWKYR